MMNCACVSGRGVYVSRDEERRYKRHKEDVTHHLRDFFFKQQSKKDTLHCNAVVAISVIHQVCISVFDRYEIRTSFHTRTLLLGMTLPIKSERQLLFHILHNIVVPAQLAVFTNMCRAMCDFRACLCNKRIKKRGLHFIYQCEVEQYFFSFFLSCKLFIFVFGKKKN